MSSLRESYPDPREAAQELLRRRRARLSLERFTTYTFPKYQVDPVHGLIAAALDAVVDGEIKRLILIAPPQHGKSELVSVRLPAYWLARRPDMPVILTSYGADLAQDKSKEARAIVESTAYRVLFPDIATMQDSRAVNKWNIHGHRGYLLAAGVGGPITGRGAQLGIIDDPFANWEQAQSKLIRDKVWNWYRGTFLTRIWETGSIVLIMTRWHSDDLVGRLLEDNAAEWKVLRLPAIAETQDVRDEAARMMHLPQGHADPLGRLPGEALAPRRYSAEGLAEKRRSVGALVWSAEYQGLPQEAEGNLFKRGWFKRFRNLGDAYRIEDTGELFYKRECIHFALCDPAASDKPTADYTALGLFALLPSVRPGHTRTEPRLLILKIHRDQLRFENVAGAVRDWFQEHKPAWVGIESVMTFDAVAREALRLGVPVRRMTPEGKSKFVRAMPAIARCESGQVLLPVSEAWIPDFLDEVAQFSGIDDAHDDQVDLLSYACQNLTNEAMNPSFNPYVASSGPGVGYR